jgi:hypothetical protein
MAYIILYLEVVNGRLKVNLDELNITVQFDDSIIEDDGAIINRMKEDVKDGTLPNWVYLMKAYKLDETTAKELDKTFIPIAEE